MHVITVLSALLAFVTSAAAQTPSTAVAPAAGSESLGHQLLDDLTPADPLKSITPPGDQADPKATNPSSRATARFDDLGEDIGQPSGSLSIARVRQGMQRAESLLGRPAATTDLGAVQQAVTVQKQVVDQLDQLIAELSKQCQGGECEPSDQQPKPGQQSQAKPGSSSSTTGQGQNAARDSTDRLNNASATPVDKTDFDELAKQLWGHLPERTREQMMQSFSEEFLPKYEQEIEEYYRRLSEDNAENRPQTPD
jgi:hypothetical protein